MACLSDNEAELSGNRTHSLETILEWTPLVCTTYNQLLAGDLGGSPVSTDNYAPLVVFDWAISWSTFNSWSTFRIRLVLHEIPWSTKDVRRNACDIFRS